MSRPLDLEPDDVMISKHVVLTEQLLELVLADARAYAGNNHSVWMRHLIRKHYGLPTILKEKN